MKTNIRFLVVRTSAILALGGALAAVGHSQDTSGASRPTIVQPPPRPQAPAGATTRLVYARDFPKLPNTFNWEGEAKMNDYFVQQFIDSANFGNLRMIPRTMMIDDAMRLIRHDPDDLDSKGQPAQYKLDNLELIGIAKHDSPVAFIINRHERSGANFATVTTRQLTEFETKSLEQLRAGAEAVVQQEASGCLVVGPVRARELCLECHAGAKAGDVLGAFSYKLTRLEVGDAKPMLPPTAPARNVAARGVIPTAPWATMSSEASVLDGLEVVIQPSRETIPTTEPLAVKVVFRNTTGQPMRLPNNTALYGDWLLKLEDIQSGKKYTAGFGTGGNQTAEAVPSTVIQPGGTFESSAAYFSGARMAEGDLDFAGFQKAPSVAVGSRAVMGRGTDNSPFPPGEYRVRLEVRFPNTVPEDGNPAPVWKHDDIVSNAVAIKIGPVPAERTGNITGQVLDRHGRPAANATLTCQIALPYNLSPPNANSPYAKNIASRPALAAAGRPIIPGGVGAVGNPVAKTDSKGAFVISNLPSGTYLVEAQLAPGDLLHWPQNALSQVVEVKPSTETKMGSPLQLDYNGMEM